AAANPERAHRSGLAAAAPRCQQCPCRVLEQFPGLVAGGCRPGDPGTSGVLQRCRAGPALHHPGFPPVPGSHPGAAAGRA
ncbi:hypothetical protein, partial [Acinetobacter baumannii]|uniref:hypothetical protein n=1 Tax=Acinetobacter baumannii TaxID=470 RepID=UPI001E443E07